MQLAQVNVAEAVAPLSSPRLHGFVQLLDRIDELARGSPGFVWRPWPAEVTAADVARSAGTAAPRRADAGGVRSAAGVPGIAGRAKAGALRASAGRRVASKR